MKVPFPLLRFVFLFVLSSFGFTGSLFSAPPHILFILADDMGWQDTSVPFAKERTKWNDRYRTPALERLAREGMKFTQAYSGAVCSPTRVSFLTGRNEARHGVTQWTYQNRDHPSSDLSHPSLSPADWNWSGLGELAVALSDILRKHSAPMPVVKETGVSVPFPDEILPSVSSVVPSTSELVVTGLGKIEGQLSAHDEQQGTAKKWAQVRKVLGADAERVIVKQLGGSLGGNTSVRDPANL